MHSPLSHVSATYSTKFTSRAAAPAMLSSIFGVPKSFLGSTSSRRSGSTVSSVARQPKPRRGSTARTMAPSRDEWRPSVRPACSQAALRKRTTSMPRRPRSLTPMSKTGPLSYSPTPWALAAARVEQRHGSGFATEFSKSWPMRGGHDEGCAVPANPVGTRYILDSIMWLTPNILR